MAEEIKNTGETPAEKKLHKLDPVDIAVQLSRPINSNTPEYISVEALKKQFGTPVTNVNHKKSDNPLAYDEYYQSLTEHAAHEGQFPLTSFVGYPVLEQIAQNGMIRTCIQTVADDVVREWIELTGGEKNSDKKLEEIDDILKRRHIKALIKDAVAKTGYFGGCMIFIDTGEEDTDLSLPLVISEKSAEIKKGTKVKFVLIDPINITPLEYNSVNPLKSDYMKPTLWNVCGTTVHGSRLIKFTDNEPPTLLKPCYNFLGIPQAQILWDYVLHWNKARVSAVEILDKLNLTVFKTNMSDLLGTPEGIAMLDVKMKAFQRYRDNNSVLVCDSENEAVENISQVISGATDVVRQALEFIACINRTPAVKLLGISPSGFNATGESDIRNYYDHIKAKQELYRDQIQKIIDIIQLITYGTIDPSIGFNFNEIGGDDLANNTNIFKTQTDVLNGLIGSGVIDNAEAREFVRTSEIGGLDYISEDAPKPQIDPEDLKAMAGQKGKE